VDAAFDSGSVYDVLYVHAIQVYSVFSLVIRLFIDTTAHPLPLLEMTLSPEPMEPTSTCEIIMLVVSACMLVHTGKLNSDFVADIA
jgi:hypothetical protein